jgi:hypothetical protein
LPIVLAEEQKHSSRSLQRGLVYVEKDPVQGFQFEGHVIVDDFGDSAWYAHDRLRVSGPKDHQPLSGFMNRGNPSVFDTPEPSVQNLAVTRQLVGGAASLDSFR